MTPTGTRAEVLRDVVVQEGVRIVGRPQPAAPSAAAPVAAAPARPMAAAADPPLLEAAFEEGRRRGQAEGREQALQASDETQRHAGFEQGLREGLAEGRAAGEREVERRAGAQLAAAVQRVERLDELLAALPQQLRARLEERASFAEDEMVALCHLAISRLLGEHLVGRDGAAHAVRAAIEQWLRASEEQSRSDLLTVHVHPADLDAMKSDELLARWLVQQGLRGVQWEASDEVKFGGCVVQGREGDLDARIETQLAALGEVLARGRARRAGAEHSAARTGA